MGTTHGSIGQLAWRDTDTPYGVQVEEKEKKKNEKKKKIQKINHAHTVEAGCG